MAGPYAKAALDRRERAPTRDQQTRRRLHPATIHWVTRDLRSADGRAAVPAQGENRARPPAPFRKPTTNVRLSSSDYSSRLDAHTGMIDAGHRPDLPPRFRSPSQSQSSPPGCCYAAFHRVPWACSAQATRANLLATATVTTLKARRLSRTLPTFGLISLKRPDVGRNCGHVICRFGLILCTA